MREPSTCSALLARIASTLEAHGIPYMVIGGHAAVLYGEPREFEATLSSPLVDQFLDLEAQINPS